MTRPASVNPTEFAILGLLAERPRSGYDIQKEVKERLSHFWSESYGHLYPMLRRLQSRRLVAVRKVASAAGRPSRNVYSVTESGRRALEAWFTEPPASSRPRNELLLRVFLGRHAPPHVLLRDVAAYRRQIADTLVQLRSTEAAVDAERPRSSDALYWKLVIDFGIRLFETLDAWSAGAEATLSAVKPPARAKR